MIRCLNCFNTFDETLGLCPYCGEIDVKPTQPIDLVPGTTLLDDRYVIGRSIGAGGFGIIYKAWDNKLEMIVAVKEYFPSKLVTRAMGTKDLIISNKTREEYEYRKKRFIAEARNMAKFSSQNNIPNVFEYFEENNSAYIVMELLEGESLRAYLHANGGKLDIDCALYIITEVGKALSVLHKGGIIHRDVAPDNIFICSDKNLRVKLLDFGAARLTDGDDDSIDIILKPGYSPGEQYDIGGLKELDERSDIYSLAATLYVMITGVKPDEGSNRKVEDKVLYPHQINPEISENLSNAIMKAMAVDRHMRFKTVDDFMNAIKGDIKVVPLNVEKKRRKIKQISGVVGALLVISIGVFAVSRYYNSVRLEEQLNPASITVWYSEDSLDETEAMNAIKADFESTYEGVAVELVAISPEEYFVKVTEAAANDNLPDLFESTGLPSDVIEKSRDFKTILKSKTAADCPSLSQYDTYYSNHKQIPIAIDIPLVCVITNGKTSLAYEKNSFSTLDDFSGASGKIAVSNNDKDLWNKVADINSYISDEEFLDVSKNEASVLLTSSSELSEINELIMILPHKFVYLDTQEIPCKYTYEWSLGFGSEDEERAAEKFLSLMLGNKYQNILLMSSNRLDVLPICKETMVNRVNSDSDLDSGIVDTTDRFRFGG